MSYSTSPFNPDQKYKGQVKSELKQADDNFNILAQAFKNNDPTTGIVNHASVADSCNNCSGSSSSSDDNFGIVPALDVDSVGGWMSNNFFINGYVSNKFFIQDTAPSYDPNHTSIWYNTKNNTVYILTKEGFNIAVDWRQLPVRDIWYGIGKLKIENGVLKVSNDGTNWITAYTNVLQGWGIVADDSNSNDDFKFVYIFADYYYKQNTGRNNGSDIKTRVVCASPSQWEITAPQQLNQSTAGWFGLHLGDIDISDGQGKMTSNGSDFDTSNYSDISNAKFLPLGWFPVSGNDGSKIVECDATITITPDNKITVSSKVYDPNNSNNYADFSCSGTFPSSANHLGSFVFNGDSYSVGWYDVYRLYDDSNIKLHAWG
jgi:hypothetical protein